MWRNTTSQEDEEYLIKAISFTGDAELYGKYMLEVIQKWPIACEHNLSNTSINRQAWIGHAACCIAINCPEHITRRAWHYLSQEQQDKANAKADYTISVWEKQHERKLINPDQLTIFEVDI